MSENLFACNRGGYGAGMSLWRVDETHFEEAKTWLHRIAVQKVLTVL